MSWQLYGAGVLSFCLLGCAQQVTLEMEAVDSRQLFSKSGVQLDCPLSLNVIDQRAQQTTYAKTIESDVLEQWVASSFSNFVTAPDMTQENADKALDVTIAVRQAYVHHLSTSHSAIVAVDATIDGDERYIRGRDTGVLWWGVESEYVSHLNGALKQVLHQLVDSAGLYCAQKDNHVNVSGVE